MENVEKKLEAQVVSRGSQWGCVIRVLRMNERMRGRRSSARRQRKRAGDRLFAVVKTKGTKKEKKKN